MAAVRLRRTQLATPASDPGMMTRAAESDADEVFLDLEDSVAPDAKVDAREPLIRALEAEDWSDKLVSYRINGLDTRWWYDDLIEVVGAAGEHLDDVIVPKVKSAADVHAVATLLEGVEVNAGLDVGGIGLEPQIEDGLGMNNVAEIAHASDRLDAVIFGPGDYSAAMGAGGLSIGSGEGYPGHYWHYALQRVAHAAKSAGLPAIDGPYADIDDEDGYRDSCRWASMCGCDGKWAIHPAQIAVANEVFAPSPEEVERARRIVEAYAEARAEGRGAVAVDGEMVDEATHKMAHDVVERAEAAGLL